MGYLLAIFLPPVAMLLAGKPVQAVLCFVLMITVVGYIPAAIWAFAVTADANADRRAKMMARAIRRERD